MHQILRSISEKLGPILEMTFSASRTRTRSFTFLLIRWLAPFCLNRQLTLFRSQLILIFSVTHSHTVYVHINVCMYTLYTYSIPILMAVTMMLMMFPKARRPRSFDLHEERLVVSSIGRPSICTSRTSASTIYLSEIIRTLARALSEPSA